MEADTSNPTLSADTVQRRGFIVKQTSTQVGRGAIKEGVRQVKKGVSQVKKGVDQAVGGAARDDR